MSPMIAEESHLPLPGIDVISRLMEATKLDVISLKGGKLRGSWGGCKHRNITVTSFITDFPCHVRMMLPSGWYMFGYFHEVPQGSWCAGMSLLSDTALIALPNSACDLRLDAYSKVTAVIAPVHPGLSASLEQSPYSYGPSDRKFSVFKVSDASLRHRYDRLFRSALDERCDAVPRLLDEDFFDGAGLDTLFSSAAPGAFYLSSYRSHYHVFRKAVHYMRENLHQDIYIGQVARAAQVSDRSLRNAFDDMLGLSPTKYLSLLRLHEAGRRLAKQDARPRTVKSVAMSCGLWDLSRFAISYHKVFGELPSDTLARAYSYAT